MGRPTSFNRDEAIETVMQEMWRNGYEANTVKALSERLGITRSSYYNAFGSREALFKLALEKYFAPTGFYTVTSRTSRYLNSSARHFAMLPERARLIRKREAVLPSIAWPNWWGLTVNLAPYWQMP